jgi:hypothetical protein
VAIERVSTGAAIVVLEESAKTHSACDRSLVGSDARLGLDQLSAEALVLPFRLVVDHILRHRPTEVSFTERDDPVQALLAYRTNPTLGERIQVGAPRGESKNCYAVVLEHSSEGCREERVSIEDHASGAAEEPVELVGDVARDLEHPRFAEVVGDPPRRGLDGS